jgi:hypothetical protein
MKSRNLPLVRRDEQEEGSRQGGGAAAKPSDAWEVESVAMYPPTKTQRRHRRDYRGDAAIGIYLSAVCALIGCFFFGLYELMQPARYANPGMAAYKPPPASVVAYAPPFQIRKEGEPSGKEDFASAIEPGSETVTGRDPVPLPKGWSPEAPPPAGKKAEKPNRKIVVSKRPRALREVRERRDAAQTIISQISANNRTAGY